MKSLNQQKTFGNNQYPKTISNSNNILSNHKFDQNKTNKTTNPKQSNQNNTKVQNEDDETNPLENLLLGFTQMKGRCYYCRKYGHKSPQCRKRHQTPCKKWAIDEFQSTQSKESDETESKSSTISSLKNSSNRSKKIGWSNVHYNFAQGYNLNDLILLDSNSTNTNFCSKNYVYNIRQSEKQFKLHTNGGELITNQICDIHFLGTHWFNKSAITNIIALADMTKHFRVTMDSKEEKL